MRIGIFPPIYRGSITGLQRVTIGTMDELLKLDCQNEYFLLGQTDWLKWSKKRIDMPIANLGDNSLNFLTMSHALDIIHSHFDAFYINPKINCAKILTIHDIRPVVHSEWDSLNWQRYFDGPVRKSAENADMIIAMSEYTKREIIDYYAISEDKIKVVYSGLYQKSTGQKKELEALKDIKFLLSVSAIVENKNQKGLIKAFIRFKEQNIDNDIKLVLTGPIGNAKGVYEELEKHAWIARDIIFTGFVSDEELNWLYANAEAFVYVSFYEGFGLPILEALAAGRAVICSEVTSMPEVGGDAVEYCNPYDIDSIVQAMNNVLGNSERREALENMAVAQAERFSYKKAAESTLEIYKMFA